MEKKELRTLMAKGVKLPLLLTVFYWIVFFSPPILISIKLNLSLNIYELFFKQFLIYTTLPFTPLPGGSGVVEIIYFGLFQSYIPSGQLVVFILLCRIVTYYIPLALGGFAATQELAGD